MPTLKPLLRGTVLSLTLSAGVFLQAGTQENGQAGAERGLQLVSLISDEQLEFIQPSADGRLLVTHDRSAVPRLWDAESMKMLALLRGHPDSVRYISLPKNADRLLTMSPKMVRIWDAKQGITLQVWTAPKDTEFSAAEVSADGQWVALGTTKGDLLVGNSTSASLATIAQAHKDSIADLEFSNDDQMVASCSADGTAKLWNPASRSLLHTLEGHTAKVRWVSFSEDSKDVLTSSIDKTAKLWSAQTGALRFSWEHIIGSRGFSDNTLMAALFVNSQDSEVIVCGPTGTMTVYNRATGQEVRKLEGYRRPVREIRRSRDGKSVATYADDVKTDTNEPLKIWDVTTGKEYPFKRPDSSAGPTAGEFSADGTAFWVGYTDGSLRRHQLATGEIRNVTLGRVLPIYRVYQATENGPLLIEKPIDYTGGAYFKRQLFDLLSPSNDLFSYDKDPSVDQQVSPDGKLAIVPAVDNDQNPIIAALNMVTNKFAWGFWGACKGAVLGENGYCVAWSNSDAALYDLNSDTFVRNLVTNTSEIQFFKIVPGNKFAVAKIGGGPLQFFPLDADGKGFKAESTATEEFWAEVFDKSRVQFSSDGSRMLVFSGTSIGVWDTTTGKQLWLKQINVPLDGDAEFAENAVRYAQFAFKNRGRIVAHINSSLVVLDVESGNQVRISGPGENSIPQELFELIPSENQFSADGSKMLLSNNRELQLVDVDSGKVLGKGRLLEGCRSLSFSADRKRILSVDGLDQLVIWDAAPGPDGELKRLGSLVMMRDNSWLVMDTAGRYDASDPGNVTGASYVLRWQGGLEPIDVAQLKSLFYEPNLLAKLMGTDKDPVRSVPSLDSIRLYPEITLEQSKKRPLSVSISLTERDQGGVGMVRVLLNGKEVLSQKSTGYFVFDAGQYSQYFLPESRLKDGHGNLLQVMVSNAKGDLVSPLKTLDLGIPQDLKTPDVNLYGLFVGVGDYVGNKRDLKAPPSDAKSLEQAVDFAAKKLLPGRVHLTSLTTLADDTRPTRAAIMSWFDSVATKATSSDIIFVFFAGHGTSQIGDARGYFFLTADADPGDVTPGILGNATISGADLQAELAKIPAGKQVIVLDTCHSGAAADSLIETDRSVSADYSRAYESIKDATGTWLLAGSAADQLSYESSNVEHGMLTYSLLEAIDRASTDGLRSSSDGDLFVDVERWLTYAASRVESLKNEVGVAGIQRPEFKRSRSGSSFDIGVIQPSDRGRIALKAPRPIVILGTFDQDEEDPLLIEKAVGDALGDSSTLKVWTDVTKHPNVYRVAGSYVTEGTNVTIRVVLQKFDSNQVRKNIDSFELKFSADDKSQIGAKIRSEVEARIKKLEAAKGQGGPT